MNSAGMRTLAEEERKRTEESAELLRTWSATIALAKTAEDLKELGKQITPQLKAQMLPAHVAELREKYQEREGQIGKTAATVESAEA